MENKKIFELIKKEPIEGTGRYWVTFKYEGVTNTLVMGESTISEWESLNNLNSEEKPVYKKMIIDLNTEDNKI